MFIIAVRLTLKKSHLKGEKISYIIKAFKAISNPFYGHLKPSLVLIKTVQGFRQLADQRALESNNSCQANGGTMAGLMTICVPVNCDLQARLGRTIVYTQQASSTSLSAGVETQRGSPSPRQRCPSQRHVWAYTYTHTQGWTSLWHIGLFVTHSSRTHERATPRIVTATKGGGVARRSWNITTAEPKWERMWSHSICNRASLASTQTPKMNKQTNMLCFYAGRRGWFVSRN